MPAPPSFDQQFEEYLTRAQEARRQHQHHDQRRELFLSFVIKAFHINPADVKREEFISLIRRHGWIDALFRDLVFEFKRDLEKERKDGLRELKDYLSHLPNGPECVGILTDGLQFEVYMLSEGELRQTDRIDLAAVEAETAFLWMDSYLFSQKGVLPTSEDLVRRFGARSPTFLGAARVLGGLLGRYGQLPSIEVKQRQWRILLTRVYGSDVTSNDLFVRHTYLAQFAKVLAYAARNGYDGSLHDPATLERIVNGRAFQAQGFDNVSERDFFAWILEPEVRDAALKVLSGLAASLVVYDLSRINQDLFKQLYQNLVDLATRHDLGEHYTPDWLAELTLEEIGYGPEQSLLDPSCGSGTFLFTAIRRLESQGLAGWDLINFALENIVGMDVHPLATTIARINYYLALFHHVDVPETQAARPIRDGKPYYSLLVLPVYTANALATTDDTLKGDALPIPVDEEERFLVPVGAARNPEALIEMLSNPESFAREQIKPGQQLELFSGFDAVIRKLFPPETNSNAGMADLTRTYWRSNLRLLKSLIDAGRNGIWVYVIENYSRPLIFALRKFDVVVGNPPWLSYRFIKDGSYQEEVKSLVFRYGLLESREVKLFTQIDLSTLFFVYCEDRYLAEGGTLAFVMPRSVLTGAQQHRAFQARGMTRVIDLKDVEPLFNVEACVVMRRADSVRAQDIPVVVYKGKLPQHEMSLGEARPYLSSRDDKLSAFGEMVVESPYYHARGF